ncbi:MAG: septal ring lytic transglycosylase RlpA family protein [Leptolyngbya sp. DLM2.Bin15]|nr:MAG: septal ring lytic transglycosylase RlpA family protein [Leptolyngbya sp. DLM2.Bin15]
MTQNNQQLWSSLMTAALVIGTLATSSSGQASVAGTADNDSDANVAIAESAPNHIANDGVTTESLTIASTEDVVKVGEYHSRTSIELSQSEAIARILPHQLDDRQAATLYIRDIPVITFLAPLDEGGSATRDDASADVKVSGSQESVVLAQASASSGVDDYAQDPVWRATAIAANLNQLYRSGVDPSSITAIWDDEGDRLVIQVGDRELIEINDITILPDTTRNPAEDALQATNRLRRLLGGAEPLGEVYGLPAPEPAPRSSYDVVLRTLSGMASWYGPGFHGNYSASGEIFDQNAMTAAHPSLPFGTQVRVTNLDTGLSVVVRINDRGPYAHGRVIDLSAGAAQVIGLVSSGVAPVSLDVLGNN